ncbi:MAG: YhcH/YjgK/YiaL family protein [Desulfobacterales bacterium]|nr:YhcH/YjgK/YiaL family protein [Desulfobacterales bacterium]
MYKFSILMLMIITFFACTPKQSNPEKWTDEEVNSWFEKQDWLGGWQVQPNASINKRSLAIHYHNNTHHWEQAFQFLKTANLKELPLGKQELEGQHLFVNVDGYTSKDKTDTRYESHKKFIDIQYVIEGEELMGLTTLDKVEVTEPYDEGKDITFYQFEGGNYIKATPENFFVFFPEDVHRPTLKVHENSPVKKIVVKILID